MLQKNEYKKISVREGIITLLFKRKIKYEFEYVINLVKTVPF